MDFQYEQRLIKERGYTHIAGIDEVGRGSLAGPVVACAFMVLQFDIVCPALFDVRDSKELSYNKRSMLYDVFCTLKHRGLVDFAVASVRPATIDATSIQKATIRAMRRAFCKLNVRPQYVIVDKIAHKGSLLPCDYTTQIRADKDVFSCSAASIVGKVKRDRSMEQYHKRYPEYRFASHKGYPTPFHYEALRKYGVTTIHRKSFRLA